MLQVPSVAGIRCPFGEARIIHAVGPIWDRTPEPEQVLERAYENSLALAASHGLTSVAFPAISTGAYRFPLDLAARIALGVARRDWGGVTDIRFVLARPDVFDAFARALAP